MRWFGGGEGTETKLTAATSTGQRTSRRSTGFGAFTHRLSDYEQLSVLDLGPTSAANITFLTGFGGRVYNVDILRVSQEREYVVRQDDGTEKLDAEKFFSENLNYPERQFDAILCWDIPDYLDEALVKPMVERIQKILKPGGILLAFFHTKDAGPDSPYCRYHIVNGEVLDLEVRPDFRLQRVFNNRHIENLFKGFASLKFFLARDNIREVLVVR
ncbi:MAG TPA: methyltransferase domain-containing protein [Candidatus Angelobacter sp.]